MLKQGIIIIATGHPNYGNMAYNLALSIKAAENFPVALIYTQDALGHLSGIQLNTFDKMIRLPDSMPGGFGAKLYLDELTPYDHTLFMDADMLWLNRKPSELFKELEGNQFTIITEGSSDAPNAKYYFWADPEEIKTAYKVDQVMQTRSEVMYFEKGTKVFKKARELKPEAKLKTIRMFGTLIPDELYFNIALALLKIIPAPWKPAYWSRLNGERMPNLVDLNKSYYLLSFGSNAASPIMKKTYDNVMKVVAHKLRLPYLFKLKSKREWAPGRLKI